MARPSKAAPNLPKHIDHTRALRTSIFIGCAQSLYA